jgi:hypothetical protein
MGILDIFKKKNDPSNPKYRLEMAQRIAGQAIKYVTERRNDVEEVIGKGGCMSLHNGEFIVFSSSDTVFRCKAEELEAWELLSKDGVVLTGPDIEHGGEVRTIIAFYVYYRK